MTIFGKEITRFIGTPSPFFILVGAELHWFDSPGAAFAAAEEAAADVGIEVQIGSVEFTITEKVAAA